jgi:hypothetical protein
MDYLGEGVLKDTFNLANGFECSLSWPVLAKILVNAGHCGGYC